ncbi:VOC family protein [Paracoccus onubensis]|uniref:VOC family protein n=1 Tax=Paracoccus onubensis TaxID=1675788 RepID=UPI00272F6997|nr:VOC family protein [Paracoccus onubensis]MDP0925738.1 VOC family protein [Paracoccus onubensis]
MTASPPPVFGTLETALYADDLHAAEDFWSGVMGFEKIVAEAGRHVFFRIAESPAPQVLLIFRPVASEKPTDPGARLPVPPHGARGPGHFCLAVAPDALDRWRSHLVAHGIEIEADFLWPDGARSIYFRDPGGNSIELADPHLWA